MLDLKAPSKNTKRQLAKAPPKRKAVGGGGRDVGKEDARKKRAMKDGSKRRMGLGEKPKPTTKAGREVDLEE